MKKLSLSAFALAGMMLVSAPAFAADSAAHHGHHGHHHHNKKKCKMKDGKAAADHKAATDDLNAASLQKSQMPEAAKAGSDMSAAPAAPAAKTNSDMPAMPATPDAGDMK